MEGSSQFQLVYLKFEIKCVIYLTIAIYRQWKWLYVQDSR